MSTATRCLPFLAGLGLLMVRPAVADENSNGGAAGAFRRLGHSAALMGLGNAGSAFPCGAESRLVNPALIGWWKTRQLDLDWHRLSMERELGGLHLLWPMRPMGAFGLSFQRAGVDGIPETTTWGEPTGREMEAADHLFSFGVALTPSRFLALGMNMNILTSSFSGMDEGATELKETTASFDVGLSVHPRPNVWTGLSLQNLGGSLAWDSSPLWGSGGGSSAEDALPLLFTVGAGAEFFQDRLLVVADYEASDLEAWELRAGVEVRSDAREMGRWALRAGFDDGSPALGVGFAWPFNCLEAGMDYAVTFHENDSDEIHVVTWRVAF